MHNSTRPSLYPTWMHYTFLLCLVGVFWVGALGCSCSKDKEDSDDSSKASTLKKELAEKVALLDAMKKRESEQTESRKAAEDELTLARKKAEERAKQEGEKVRDLESQVKTLRDQKIEENEAKLKFHRAVADTFLGALVAKNAAAAKVSLTSAGKALIAGYAETYIYFELEFSNKLERLGSGFASWAVISGELSP